MNLPAAPSLSSSRITKTASRSLSALGIIVGIQLIALVVAGVQRIAPPQAEMDSPAQTSVSAEVLAAERAILQAAAAQNQPRPISPLPVQSLPPVPNVAPLSSAPERPTIEARIAALVSQARQLRERGDMQGALVKLREADTIEQDNPLVLTELAGTYEAMSMLDQAMTLWRRVAAMGKKAGTLADLAAMKLAGTNSRPDPASATSALPASLDDEGLQPGATLGLIDVTTIEEEDPEAARKLKLRIGIKARSTVDVDVQDVIIQVFFYDVLDGEHVVQTDARVSSQWVTPPADWSEDGIEILEVGYFQTKPGINPEDDFPQETRDYLGYIVRVYYQDELQDVRADPVRLLSLFPPPLQVETNPR